MKSIPVGGAEASSTQVMATKPSSAVERAKSNLINKLRGPAPEQAAISTPSAPVSIPEVSESVGQVTASEPSPVSEAVAAPAAKEPEDSISSQFAALARKEKAQRARVQAEQAKLKAERDALESERESLKSQQADYSTKYIPKDRLQNDTIAALQDAGLNYDQIVDLMLKQQENPAVAQAEAKLRAMEAKLAQMEQAQKKSFEDLQKDNEQAALNQMSYDVKRLVKDNPEFETIDKTDSYEDVVDLIKEVHDKGWEEQGFKKGTIVDIETAARHIEKLREEELYKYASSVSKISKRLQPKPTATAQVTPSSTKEQELKTLTNRHTSSRTLSARERAIRAAQGLPND